MIAWFSTALSAAVSKPVLVYYRPWFTAKPYTTQWGWHWTMDKFNPDQVDASGQRRIASWYRPLIGPYDSADPAVIEYHLQLMKLSGIDGIIANWFGPDDYRDYATINSATLALFDRATKAGMKFALCYEGNAIRELVNAGRIAADDAAAHAGAVLSYAESYFFSHTNYLRHNGRPVLLVTDPYFLKSSNNWERIFFRTSPSNRPVVFTQDYALVGADGAFSWPPMWLSLSPGARGVLSAYALQNYFERYEQRANIWPVFISSAFPRFHDIHHSAGVRDYIGYLGDQKGRIFVETLTRAFTNRSSFVQIVTWNDFGEGTMVEPTVEYGFRDLGIIQELRRSYVEPNFIYTTNDLALPGRIFELRRIAATNAAMSQVLDAVTANIMSGHLYSARRLLNELQPASLDGK